MKTWRSWFVWCAFIAFVFIATWRGFEMPGSVMWRFMANVLMGAALAAIINQWENAHEDWLDRNYYTDEEMAEKEREESDPHYHRKP